MARGTLHVANSKWFMRKNITIKSIREMNSFALAVARTLRGGETLALTGELGAGKTAFVKGLAKALGIKQVVQSPTFLLMKCYPIVPRATCHALRAICHVDAYRIKNERELLAIGLGEKLGDPQTATAIEWADLVPELIPKGAIKIKFEHGSKKTERIITITHNK
jgi:tRNA threonylcarbamoyladenosine biosynthesis protein TsaE